MKSIKALLAAAVVLASSAASAQTARIATWNVGGFSQIPSQRLERIVEAIKLLDADIVVLPELNPLSHGKTIAEKLSQTPGACFRSAVPNQPLASQEIGVVFKCSVTVSDVGLVVRSDLNKQGYRNAAVANVKIGSFDFVLLGLHLKAGRGAANRALRNQQLGIISTYLQGVLRGGQKDALVVGDFNMIPGEDDSNFGMLNETEALRFVSSETLSSGFSYISNGGPGNLFGWLWFHQC